MNKASYTIVAVLPSIQEGDQTVSTTTVDKITFNDVGGYEQQKHEIKEAVIDPIKNYQFFEQLQIKPPNATLLYGPPGCGKSFIASAVAYMCGCNFISVSASNCVQKYLGEGARYIREIFNQAREKAPCIVFFDEIDAIAQKRKDTATEGDKEVQRILNELLTQIDGFNGISQNPEKPVKVIFATNQINSIDPALLRSGRCDRRILIDYPTKREKRAIFNVCTKDMSLESGIDFEVYIQKAVKISGADIRQICIEAGMQAIKDGRWQCNQADFDKAWENVVTIGKSKEKKYE